MKVMSVKRFINLFTSESDCAVDETDIFRVIEYEVVVLTYYNKIKKL